MTPSGLEYVRNWLIKANNDIKVAERELNSADPVTDAVCFHCQQAVEKFLKTYLIFHSREVGKTHNVYILLEDCGEIDAEFVEVDLKNINFFGVNVRYPDEFYTPTIDESREYLDIAKKIKSMVEDRLQL
ncbi:MAG TPA: HEPN domain-containing protein [Spirochaetota bacterium]|nr:HEPN domain-containing protein [Spirochaetota bacterium]HPC41158.1 HEPN domain-containing protein [Spirochaetota bacterium]HPL18868.1 HEPN domain-containing protein [Spirochaetota bacterium]HQF07078.1 HEPN domain-containing protein [Spirochaetota bacterium]HQH95815.1 HEPN domain-containing protein [Spirochaetota bacterium]